MSPLLVSKTLKRLTFEFHLLNWSRYNWRSRQDKSATKMARPLLLPDSFNGEGSWEQWRFHFLNVAAVNVWNEAHCLKRLKVRLTGRAQIAFQRLSPEIRNSYDEAMEALKERFEPSSRKTRYQAELLVRYKMKAETWGDLAEDFRLLADKVFPDLEDGARERLALNAYMAQLEQPQVAFGVKQRTPDTLDAAVTATLELESYLTPQQMAVSNVR